MSDRRRGPGGKALRRQVAVACRVLAHQGLAREIYGHVSARIHGSDEMWLRCRGGLELGVLYTTSDQVRKLKLDGRGRGLGDDYSAPIELPIHGEILRARPDVNAVVHAHPRYALLCGLTGIELRPIFGAFDPDALALAAEGVPVFPRSVLIDSPELGQELAATLGDHSACLMRGHGITTVGASVEQAAIRAIKLEALARVHWELAAAGVHVEDLPAEELESFARRAGSASVVPRAVEWIWEHYIMQLATYDFAAHIPHSVR